MRRPMLLTLCLMLAGLAPALAEELIIKLGTVAPEGSVWHDALLQVRQDWRAITDGEVELRIYAGGVLGGEAEMVRKLQRRSLDAVAITGAGLPRIDRSVEVLNIPLLFESYGELDYVRSRIAPELERRLEEKSFKVLSWSDAGWVYFFSTSPVRTPAELRQLRLWISAGAPEAETLFREFGFHVVPLPVTDMLTALQTGMIEAIDVPPLFSMLDRSYQIADHMTDLRWAPLNAATVIASRSWARVPEQHHDAMLASIRDVARATQEKIRHSGTQAIVEMQARGLTVVAVDRDALAEWRHEARAAYPALRASIGAPELFDAVLDLAAEYKETLAPTTEP